MYICVYRNTCFIAQLKIES